MKKDILKISLFMFLFLPVLSVGAITKVTCGNVTDIPLKIPEITTAAFFLIQVAVPVILVIMGSIDLFKGITAGKEEEIKKGQQMFIKRIVMAALIFFVVVIVKFISSIVAESSGNDIIDCIDCFVDSKSCTIQK